MFWSTKNSIEGYNPHFSSYQLKIKSRIIVVDDERPELIDELSSEGYAVDYDETGELAVERAKNNLVSLIILDFKGVGRKYGDEDGLSLLKHLRMINPSIYILAYTSKPLISKQSDFFRITDGTLEKDAGLTESVEQVENALRKSFDLRRIFDAIIKLQDINGQEEINKLEKAFIESVHKKDKSEIYKVLSTVTQISVKELAEGTIGKLVEYGLDLVTK